ncbi:UDP-glucosyltransferase 2-like isoform X2 [Drosophila obscura]|uniref:UDP-glucosyltransferase 2-like isoform X2 n=1 Tax=Drosophila obscura TaxID=7282 RepID=UPI001BB27D11|nr:UDP-glucosyltransferase 2-like isoform X2 [Drosophila obscura]
MFFALRWCCLGYLLFCCCLLPNYLEGARILALFPIPSPSHYYYALPYLKSLALQGHQVTSINPYPQKQPVQNFRDIPIPEVFVKLEEFLNDVTKTKTRWGSSNIGNEYCVNLSKAVLNNDQVRREILKPGKAQFDLIVVDLWRLDALYGLAGYFDAPLIGLAPYGTDWKIDQLVGNTSPISYLHSPTSTGELPNRDTYFGRLNHAVERAVTWINWHWKFVPKHEQIYRKYFSRVADKVPLSKIASNFALILANQHFTLAPPRPYVPNVIEVAGLHIDEQQPQELPEDMANFIKGAGQPGVIYFSLGTIFQSNSLSTERLQVLLQTFAGLPQRVLWKFEDEQLPGRPENVFISKWFPQQAVLAQPQVKLFITHGGMLSTVESLHYGKPMLGLPCFYDQFRNMDHIRRMGLGLVLSLKEMSASDFKSALRRLLTEESFAVSANETAHRYRDQPMAALAKANWWTEYILRHKGAAHMRVAGRELDFFTYHSLDVIGTLLGAALLSLILILAMLWQLARTIARLRLRSERKKQKQKNL